jgi:hypothetical protein
LLEWRLFVCHFTVDNPGKMYGIVDMKAVILSWLDRKRSGTFVQAGISPGLETADSLPLILSALCFENEQQ